MSRLSYTEFPNGLNWRTPIRDIRGSLFGTGFLPGSKVFGRSVLSSPFLDLRTLESCVWGPKWEVTTTRSSSLSVGSVWLGLSIQVFLVKDRSMEYIVGDLRVESLCSFLISGILWLNLVSVTDIRYRDPKYGYPRGSDRLTFSCLYRYRHGNDGIFEFLLTSL